MRKVKELSVIILILLVLASACWAVDAMFTYTKNRQVVQPGQIHTAHNTWVDIDATTSTGTEPTDLAVTERTYTTVVAAIAAASSGDEEISIYGDDAAEIKIMESWNAVRFRCIGITDGGSITYQIYLGTLNGGTDCELAKAGQLVFTIGTQASITSTYELADTVAVTPYDWPRSWGYASPVGNQVCEAVIDFIGADLIVAVCTSANCDTKLLAKGY